MTKPLILDCESFDSAAYSVSNAFNCSTNVLIELMSNSRIDEYFEEQVYLPFSFSQYLLLEVQGQLGNARPFDYVNWFHTTRTADGATFSDGILPLGNVLPKLHETLVSLVEDSFQREFLRDVLAKGLIPDWHYQNKTGNSMHWGPFGILVREVAFNANQLGQHDYLSMPEIIEDICNGIGNGIGMSLLKVFQSKLKPTIVKFSTKSEFNDTRCLEAALCYIRSMSLKRELDSNSVYCFNGNGKAVPSSDILYAKFV